MALKCDHSFFNGEYIGKRILLLVPHQDDEINVAGNLISVMSEMKAEVFVVYSTNGDYANKAETRVKEAVKALEILGIDKNHILFMGYGDSYNDFSGMHIFDAHSQVITSKAGYERTYCVYGFHDFAYQYRGKHSSYCRMDFRKDLKDIILWIRADLIICVDYDQHPDHRWLTLAFDEVMGDILRTSYNNYQPEILKKFAYSLAFSAVPDLCNVNLKATARPQKGKTANYIEDVIDRANWIWDERIRIPVSYKNRKNYFLAGNRLMKAICAHKSQFMVLHAESIINSDDIYWRRRTDSASYKADISASSGNTEKLNDFLYINTADIKNKRPSFDDYLWLPDESDDKREICFHWNERQRISIVKIFGAADQGLGIKAVRIRYDDGYDVIFSCDPDETGHLEFETGTHTVRECIINLLEADSMKVGISEIEFYELDRSSSIINSYIKIMIDDNYVYHYFLKKSSKECDLKIYKYNIPSDMKIKYEILKGKSKVINNKLIIHNHDKIIGIRASVSGLDIYDEVWIERNTVKSNIIQIFQKMEHLWITHYKIRMYIVRWGGYIKSEGIAQTICRALRKLKSA